MSKVYYEVRGQRALYEDMNVAIREGRAEAPRRVGTTPHVVLRYEALELNDAQGFATFVYKKEDIICTIDEVTR